MRTFFHRTLDPACRGVRMILGEKRLECSLVEAMGEQEFPVLVEENDAAIPHSNIIAEYLNESYPEPDLLGYDPLVRVDVRRIAHYFANDISQSTTTPLLNHKVYGPARGNMAAPNSVASANVAMQDFLEFVAILDDANNWLAGPSFSIADIFAAAQISTLDYLGLIKWEDHVAVQRWYRRVKSRRSMADVLAEQIDGIVPPSYYADPDF